MSKGMKQKVAIVAAFMHDPAVLVLDEPTNGLDPLMQNRFVELILEEKQRGKTVLMSSHMFEEVEKTCDRVAILKEGRLAVVSDRASLAAEKQKRYLVTLASAEEAAAFAEEPLAVTDRAGTTVTVAVRQEGMAAFTAALHRHEVTDIAVRGQNLEEIFMHYYGGESQ